MGVAYLSILLHFCGKGVISKKVSAKGDYLKEVFFNASIDDFYTYELDQNDQKFISIARKSVIDPYFEAFAKSNYLVVDYSIGPFVGVMLKKLLQTPSFFSNTHELNFEEDTLVSYENKEIQEQHYQVGDESINGIKKSV